MADLIDRQKAIETAMTMYERCTTGDIADLRDLICESLAVLPTADADMSEYSDRLWKLAYERGKNERFVTCKYCKNRPFKIHEDREPNGFNLDARMIDNFSYYCPFMCEDGWYSTMPPDDFYCKNGEWREDTKYGKE